MYENDYEYLNAACEFAKTAADMSLPLEMKPAPEAGSQAVAGMTNNATVDPNSVGAQVYADAIDAEALAQAKEQAAQVLAKQASIIRAVYGL